MNFKKTLADLFKNKTTTVAIFLIVVLGLIIYANSLNGQFIWDDEYLVQKNVLIRNWSNLPKILTNEIGAGTGKPFNYYRPLPMASYVIDYHVWRLNVFGYRLTNLLLHILVGLCIYWLISILFGNKLLSLLTAVLFTVHPINTEAVAYISGRTDLLMGLFSLLTLIFYIKWIQLPGIKFCALALISYILALLSKESVIFLPFLILVYHLILKKKIEVKKLFSFFIITIIYTITILIILKLPHLAETVTTTAIQRLPGFFVALTNYIKLLILPVNLHMEYGNYLFDITNHKAIIGMLLIFLFIIYIMLKPNKNRIILFATLWFAISLLPFSNIYPLNAYMAEHWLYIPSIGFFLILSYLLINMGKRKYFGALNIIAIFCLLIFYSCLTIKQNTYWSKPIIFYERTLKYAPDSARINNNLGTLYTDMGEYKKAVNYLNRAIHYDPSYVKSYNNLGNIYYKISDREKAVNFYEKALEIEPNYEEAYYNLGIIYNDAGAKEKAIELFKKAIEINPEYTSAYNNFATIYMNFKKYGEAITLLNNAVKINPYYAEAYNNLGISYFKLGEKEKALKAYKKAIELNPKYAEAYNNLGLLYNDMGGKGASIIAFKKAIEASPTYTEAYNNLGVLYRDIGEMKKAIETFNKAMVINPKYALAYYNLSLTYFFERRYKLAVEYYDRAKALGFSDPTYLKDLEPYRKQDNLY